MKIRKHEDLRVPHGRKIVWRYMGLDKFLDLAINQRLYFVNASDLSDQYEVTLPPYTLKERENALRKQGLDGTALADEMAAFEQAHKPLRNRALVSCWSLGRYESYALWKIYLDGSRTGVAIRTSVTALRHALENGGDPQPEELYLAEVEYGDYLPDEEINPWTLVSRKRNFYAYENELRLFMLKEENMAGRVQGRFVRVDLDALVDRIYLSPFAGAWFRKTFEHTLKRISPTLVDKLEMSLIRDQ